VGILARGTRRLTLRNNDLSNNWKPRLFSLVDTRAWSTGFISSHEKDEWLRFGAAIYLQDVKARTAREPRGRWHELDCCSCGPTAP